jgi:protocatechuate 3,4-dioxygenase beta subunit
MISDLTRRALLHGLGAVAAVHLTGCADEKSGANADAAPNGSPDATALADGSARDTGGLADAETYPDASGDADAETFADAEPDAGLEDSGADAGQNTGAWATGGTAAMSGNYPDPFLGGIGPVCSLYCASILGPCYVETIERMDISESERGLPVRLAFLVVDDNCSPIEGATVDIWHTNANGIYSGEKAPNNCTFGDVAARSGKWMRGIQTTDVAGRVDFNTCFPGWYAGRTIHIHFTIRLNGVEHVTSQLFFEDSLCDEIVGTQPIYLDRGGRDTLNAQDGVLRNTTFNDYLFQTQRMPDGAMMAWKALVIRSSPQDLLCEF